MLIAHSRPEVDDWDIVGTGSAILSSTTELDDGRPDSVTSFRWRNGTQNTSTTVKIQADWTEEMVVGLVGISNIDLPEGTKISIGFRRSTDTSKTYPYTGSPYVSSQRVVEGPHGERTAWFKFQPGATPVIGCEVTIFNDVDGVAEIVASQIFHIGEIFIGAAQDVCVALQPVEGRMDPTVNQFSWNNQPYTSPGVPYRTLQFKLRTAKDDEWFDSYLPLLAKIDLGQSCAYVLSWTDASGSFSATQLHRYAMIGIATQQPTRTGQGLQRYDSGVIAVTEAPIPV